jgi:hypothetical protein
MDKIFDIAFNAAGRQYKGWVNPSDNKNAKGLPSSFHVVLNDTSLGILSYHNGKWAVNEERPAAVVEAAGREIEKQYSM